MVQIKDYSHAALAINRQDTVRREEYLDYMTFRSNERPLFTEIFGPLIGLKEEWAEQGAAPEELDLSAFEFRSPMKGRHRGKHGVDWRRSRASSGRK